MSHINARWEHFAREYVLDHNATRAYKAAGYRVKSDLVAAAAAARLLTHVKVREMIDRLERQVAAKLDITKEKIEREIASMAFVDIRDFYNDDGTLKPPKEWTREMAAAVAQLEVFEEYQGQGQNRQFVGYTKKLKLWPKLEANALLGATHGIGVRKVEVGRPGDFDDEETLRKRVQERARKLAQHLPANVLALPSAK